MKRFIYPLLFLLATAVNPVYGQIITTDPEFPVATDSVTIFYDATQGTAGLKDYTGEVYAHTGVITDKSTSDSDWKYVVADWGENIDKIKMERVEANLYKLNISPSIRTYYGVPDGESIDKMAFVFRNADGSKEGKDDGGKDIFAEVYKKSFNVMIIQPDTDPSFVGKTESLPFTGIGSGTSSSSTLSLYINNQLTKEVTNDTLEYTFASAGEGVFNMMLIGSDSSSADTAYRKVIVNPDVVFQTRPANMEDGITYVDDTTVRLSLFAPHKKFVYLIGDVNNWQIDTGYFMKRDSVNADSSWYWIELNGLSSMQEYAFQYLVDGGIRVADPYAEKVLDPVYDKYISETLYPGLKAYPHGKTEHIAGVFQPGRQAYSWSAASYDRPAKEELVIYELLIRDFIENHDYKTMVDTLDYLDRLGVNAIELMPVNEFDANSSWGYNPTFHLAADKYYGPAEGLKKFIDECHKRGIAVILDVVLNHAWGPSPLVRLWNDGDFGKPTSENPYLNREPKHDFNVGYDFNHESSATQYFVDRVNEYWLEEYRVDGFRFDLSKGFTQKNTLGNMGAWGQYDASRVRLLKRMADRIWAIDDSAYVIMEHFADNTEEKELSDYGMMLWGNMNHNYNEATMGYHDSGKSDFSGIYHGKRGWSHPHLVGYMESHDEQRLMYRNLSYGNRNSTGTYDVRNLATALDRMKLAGAFFFTIPGPKMIWQFGELGYDVSIDENGRTGEKPVKWEYLSDDDRKKLYGTYRALIRLRNAHPAFTSGNSNIVLDLAKATKRIRINHAEMDVSIVGNFDVVSNPIKPEFSRQGKWFEYFSGDSITVADTDTAVDLNAGEFRIYTTRKFEAPEEGLVTNLPPNTGGTDVTQLTLYQNYPNPFNPSTTIPYELPEKRRVFLKLFNILGQEVKSRDLGEQPAGRHEITLDFTDLSSGMYIYKLEAGKEVSIRKLMFLK